MRRSMQKILTLVALTTVLLFGSLASAARCCPFCSAPSLTLSEQLSQSDAATLVQWVEAKKGEKDKAGITVYEIVTVVHGPKDTLKKGGKITLARYRAGKKGNLFLLMGSKGTTIEWGSPLEVSETSFNYISQAPSPEATIQKRLAYFLKFLEFPDQLISNDAYAEFANAPYKDISTLSDKMPREKIRKWIDSDETPATRRGLYGLLLGLCGDKEDIAVMKKLISAKSEDFRLGIDGVMSGYLLLTGADGLELINETKLRNKDVPFSETYAAMQALRFMWTYSEGTISKNDLRKSMRILLDRPELADLVIADLARWKDWSVQDQLMGLYGAKQYDIPSIKRAIVRYLLVSTKDVPKVVAAGEGAQPKVETPAHVVKGKKYLAELRKNDPKTVKDAERFFFLK